MLVAIRFVVLAILLSGCSLLGGSETATPAEPTQPVEQQSAAAAPAPSEPVDAPPPTPEPAPATSAPPSGSAIAGADGGQTVTDLDLSDRHPNGATLAVSSITTGPTSISVDVLAVNGYTQQIELNGRGLFLIDDLGNGYNFSEPTTNGSLVIESGAELSGTLVFLGQLDPAATTLTLKTNVYNADDPIDTASRYDRATSPDMLIERIPVPS